MYDFWFTLGTAVIDPTLIDKIAALAAFDFGDRSVSEIKDGKLNVRHGPSTGFLQNVPTTAVRKKVFSFVDAFSKARFSGVPGPPIGIYNAGRFCQLVKIPSLRKAGSPITFKDAMSFATIAHTNAVATVGMGPSVSAVFTAFLGLCLMDSQVELLLKTPLNSLSSAERADLDELVAEFRFKVDDANLEWKLAKEYVADKEFKRAAGFLMGNTGDLNPWAETGTTEEQFFFWPDHTEYAIP